MNDYNRHGNEQEEVEQTYVSYILGEFIRWLFVTIIILFFFWITLTLMQWLIPSYDRSNPTLKQVIENQIEYIKSKKIK